MGDFCCCCWMCVCVWPVFFLHCRVSGTIWGHFLSEINHTNWQFCLQTLVLARGSNTVVTSISPIYIFDNIIGGCFWVDSTYSHLISRLFIKLSYLYHLQVYSRVLSLPTMQKTFGFLLPAPICHQRLLLSLPKIQKFLFLCKIHL